MPTSPTFAELSAGDFLRRLGFNAENCERYTGLLRDRGLRMATQLEGITEETLAAYGFMRGHAMRVVMEFHRMRREAIAPPAETGMERHGSMLDPSPLTTPVSPNRRFPTTTAGASPRGDAAAGAPGANGTGAAAAAAGGGTASDGSGTTGTSASPGGRRSTSLIPSPFAGPADLARGGTLEPQDFTCFVCMEFVISPRTVACGHTFCAHCVSHWLEVRQDATCPLCRKSICGPDGKAALPPLNKMLDDVSRKAFPERHRSALRRVEESIRIATELRKWQLFTRHPANALLVKVTCESLSGGVAIPRSLETAMLRMPRLEFCPPRVDAAAGAISCETGPSRIDALNFNVTAASIQAAVIALLELRPGHTFLDVGTGSGAIAAWAATQSGPTGAVLAIDSDPQACKYAARNIRMQHQHAVQTMPPRAPPRPEHPLTWWVHPAATAFGTATLIEPSTGAPRAHGGGGDAAAAAGGLAPPPELLGPAALSHTLSSEEHQVSLRITHFDAERLTVAGIIVAGKSRTRHSRVRGVLKVQQQSRSPSGGSGLTERLAGLKPTRARSASPETDAIVGGAVRSGTRHLRFPDGTPITARGRPSTTSRTTMSREPTVPLQPREAGPSPAQRRFMEFVNELPRSAVHLEEEAVFGDNPKQQYHFTSPDTVHPADDSAIAGSRLHYVLRLSVSAAEKTSDLRALDGFVGYKNPKGKMLKIAELSLALDDVTAGRIARWEAQHPVPSKLDDAGDDAVTPPRDSDDDGAAAAAAAATIPGVSPIRSVNSSSAPQTPPPMDGAEDSDPDDMWRTLPAALETVHVAKMNVFDLIGTLMVRTDDTHAALATCFGTERAASIGEFSGLFDRVFVGAEPQSEREFAFCVRLLKDGGRMVVPYRSELLLVRREGQGLVCEPKMNVSFGPLKQSDAMLDAATEICNELRSARHSPASPDTTVSSALRLAPARRQPPRSAPGQRTVRPAVNKSYFTQCCGVPVAKASWEALTHERVLGDRLRLLEDSVRVFVPPGDAFSRTNSRAASPVRPTPRATRGGSSKRFVDPTPAAAAAEVDVDAPVALADAFDSRTVHLIGLGCNCVIVRCPCGKPVGARVVSPPTHAPASEPWVNALLLSEKLITTVKPNGSAAQSPTTANVAASQRATNEISCKACSTVFALRTKVTRETMDWFELPASAVPEESSDRPAPLTRSTTLSRSMTATPGQLPPAVRFITAALITEVDQERVTLSRSLFNHYSGRNVHPCRYSLVHCQVCRATLGCHVAEPLYPLDLPAVAPLCGRFIIVLDRVSGMQASQRLDVLQRVFSAIMSGGTTVPDLNQAPARRFDAGELMEFFTGSSDEDDEEEEEDEHEDEDDVHTARSHEAHDEDDEGAAEA